MDETASGAGEKDFLHPLEKADESRLAVSAALLLDRLQIQQDFFKTLKIKNILNIVVVIAVVIWLLNLLGLTDNLRGIRVGS